jgi:hypothetical protein
MPSSGSKALLVGIPPVRLDVLGQFPGGFWRETAAASDGFHAKPNHEIIHLVWRQSLRRYGHQQSVVFCRHTNHVRSLHLPGGGDNMKTEGNVGRFWCHRDNYFPPSRIGGFGSLQKALGAILRAVLGL